MQTESFTVSGKEISSKTAIDTAKAIGPELSKYVAEDENLRRLSSPVINTLREGGLYRLFLPKSLEGFEADPVTTARVVEEIASHNAAAGWSLMVANTSLWWTSRLSSQGVEALFADGRDAFVAGAFHPPMKATPVVGGFRINGRSPLTSNVHEARWIFVTAFVIQGEKIKMNNGIPEIIGVMMKSEDCNIIDTWHTFGMRATDSNDVEAHDVYVPEHLAYYLTPEFEPNKYFSGALYQFPAIGASIASLIAPIALAVAKNAISELISLSRRKVPFGSTVPVGEKSSVQRKIGIASGMVRSSEAYLYQTLADAWEKTKNGEKLSLEEKGNMLLACTNTNQMCVQAVDLMYSAAGTSAIYTKSKLAQHFVNAQVIRQHGFSNESRYETVAQIQLGLHPDLPVVAF